MKKFIRLYNSWIKDQISYLNNFKLDVKNPDYIVNFDIDLPFKVSILLKENPKEPEYIVQFLFKQPIDKSGLWIETGTWRGEMITRMAKANPDKTIYGFDSFEGFPEDGRPVEDWNYPGFNLNGNLPSVPENVILTKGWFKDTLPKFLQQKNSKISFISIDCDLYSSTIDVLESIKDYITDRTIISLDDAWHYDGFLDHQLKALYEFIIKYNYTVKWICYRGDMFDFNRLNERKGEQWNWKRQFVWRRNNNYSDCALFLIKN